MEFLFLLHDGEVEAFSNLEPQAALRFKGRESTAVANAAGLMEFVDYILASYKKGDAALAFVCQKAGDMRMIAAMLNDIKEPAAIFGLAYILPRLAKNILKELPGEIWIAVWDQTWRVGPNGARQGAGAGNSPMAVGSADLARYFFACAELAPVCAAETCREKGAQLGELAAYVARSNVTPKSGGRN